MGGPAEKRRNNLKALKDFRNEMADRDIHGQIRDNHGQTCMKSRQSRPDVYKYVSIYRRTGRRVTRGQRNSHIDMHMYIYMCVYIHMYIYIKHI
jgi:hypothetical protein